MVDSAVQKTEESPLNAANEKQLFHGTSPDVVDAICKQNFDWRKSGKNATKYGDGSYFADNARFSSQYAKMDEECYYFIFLAKVLVGSYTVGKPDYRRPPPREPSNPASDLYDSCVDRIHNPTIFVVFDIDQYYPEYIIKFLKLDSSVASQASSTNTVKQPPSSNSKFQKPTTTTGNHRIKSTNIGVSGQRLKANKELASSTPNLQQQPSKTPGNSQAKSAKTGASSHNLRSVPSTSTPSLQQAISAAKNPRRHSVDSGMLGLRSKRGKRFNAKLKKSRCLIQ